MKQQTRIIFAFLLAIFFACRPAADQPEISSPGAPKEQRIISLSGMLTEVLFELGYGDRIVGLDVTSTYPDATADIPKLGHISQLNAEAILQLRPDVIFVEQASRNQPALEQLRSAGIEIVEVPADHQLYNSVQAARVMAAFLGTGRGQVDQMQQRIEKDSLELAAHLSRYQMKPKILFIYARGSGRLSVAGANTSAAVIIEKAGGQNAVTAFEDFQVLTPEALVEAAPDVILMFSSGLASLDGVEALSQIPGMDQTPAYRDRRVVAMDGHYLTAFGPRAARAALELSQAIHQTPQQ